MGFFGGPSDRVGDLYNFLCVLCQNCALYKYLIIIIISSSSSSIVVTFSIMKTLKRTKRLCLFC